MHNPAVPKSNFVPNADATRPLIIVAHPDDEAVGIGAHLPCLQNAAILSVTDGSPFNLYDAHRYGFSTREEYAKVRRQEQANALRMAGIEPEQVMEPLCADQETAHNLLPITHSIMAKISTFKPDFIYTHPYEGGHPDHDAVALAVHAAIRLLKDDSKNLQATLPAIVEMASYHNSPSGIETGTFLPPNAPECNASREPQETVCILTDTERDFKRRLLATYATQQETLDLFSLETERFRPAPFYDFTRPPHEGQLFYEGFNWNMDGAKFRALACEVLASLGLGDASCL